MLPPPPQSLTQTKTKLTIRMRIRDKHITTLRTRNVKRNTHPTLNINRHQSAAARKPPRFAVARPSVTRP